MIISTYLNNRCKAKRHVHVYCICGVINYLLSSIKLKCIDMLWITKRCVGQSELPTLQRKNESTKFLKCLIFSEVRDVASSY